ncbi:VOC family protein [Nocardioides sp. SYSU D00065]|uniref:VOC family protein n=1 Tax=Nocardioides sp. SYSU D00065 TaxID=2817378 RepID=UPI001B33CE3F|nr:VOC family protein [Nocardioides sp. SYSU D00065]
MPRALHHLDLWVDDVTTAEAEWGWLLAWCGWDREEGTLSWVHGDGTYLFMEHSPDQRGAHDRLRPGINHLAMVVDTREALDRMRAESTEHGWHELFADRYPHAGGERHVALYLESSEGFEVEVVVGE